MKLKEKWASRTRLAIVACGVSLSCLVIPPTTQAQVGVNVGFDIRSPSDFYSPLAAYGTWVDEAPYGRCWRPSEVSPGWRPYTVGHWEWTDVGWYWVSDEPWSWACYHYGSWVVDPNYGWVWVPGTEWAPAWVRWREAPDYIGWAPCGPGGVAVGDSYFAFVDVHHFHDRLRPRELVFNNPGILRRSRPIGGFRRETRDFDGFRRQVAINRGPGVDPIQRATGTRFTPRPVGEVARETPRPNVDRNREPKRNERPQVTQQPPQTRTGREQGQLYREAPQTQPAPTGRQEQRIYREAPTPQPTPHPRPAPNEVPRRPALPQVSRPPTTKPEIRPLPPTGRPSPNGRAEGQERRREEIVPQRPPAAAAPQTPAPVPRSRERDRDRDGE